MGVISGSNEWDNKLMGYDNGNSKMLWSIVLDNRSKQEH